MTSAADPGYQSSAFPFAHLIGVNLAPLQVVSQRLEGPVSAWSGGGTRFEPLLVCWHPVAVEPGRHAVRQFDGGHALEGTRRR